MAFRYTSIAPIFFVSLVGSNSFASEVALKCLFQNRSDVQGVSLHGTSISKEQLVSLFGRSNIDLSNDEKVLETLHEAGVATLDDLQVAFFEDELIFAEDPVLKKIESRLWIDEISEILFRENQQKWIFNKNYLEDHGDSSRMLVGKIESGDLVAFFHQNVKLQISRTKVLMPHVTIVGKNTIVTLRQTTLESRNFVNSDVKVIVLSRTKMLEKTRSKFYNIESQPFSRTISNYSSADVQGPSSQTLIEIKKNWIEKVKDFIWGGESSNIGMSGREWYKYWLASGKVTSNPEIKALIKYLKLSLKNGSYLGDFTRDNTWIRDKKWFAILDSKQLPRTLSPKAETPIEKYVESMVAEGSYEGTGKIDARYTIEQLKNKYKKQFQEDWPLLWEESSELQELLN